MSAPDRRALVDRDHREPSVRRQCQLVGVARSGVYREPRPVNGTDLAVMRRIDELFTAWPFLGSRRMAVMLRADGHAVNGKRMQRLMRRMGIAALGPKPRTSKPAPGHKIFPYLLRNMANDRPVNACVHGVGGRHHLCPDRARVPLPCSRHRLGQPGGAGVAAVERLWRSLKYEDIYLKGYADGREARAGISLWMAFYNMRRPHQALANRTPLAVWRDGVTGALGNTAVDMTLRLDNAIALPTCPQPPLQQ